MARPQKLNAEWFTHKGDLRNDRRVKAIRTATGMAGYGVLHCLLETLTDADNTTIPVDDFELELLAGDFGVDASQVLAVLEVGKKVGWFAIDAAQMLTCPELNKWLEMHFDKRNRSRNPRSGDSLSQPVTETPVPVTETPHSTLHNSTVQDITTTSSFQSEVDAASAAAPAPVEEEYSSCTKSTPELLPESPADASHTEGGAADVGTGVEEVAAAPAPTLKATKGGRASRPRRTVPSSLPDVPFSQSAVASFEDFAAAFVDTDYAMADLRHYHQLVATWRDKTTGEEPCRKDWVATAKRFMLNDRSDNRLKLSPGVEHYNPAAHGPIGANAVVPNGAGGAFTGQTTTGYRSERYNR